MLDCAWTLQGTKWRIWRKSLISLGNSLVLAAGFSSPLQGWGEAKTLPADRIERDQAVAAFEAVCHGA